MAIGAGWHTEEGWKFHMESKNTIRRWIENTSNLDILRGLFVDEKWIIPNKGDKVPMNYPMLLELWATYKKTYPTFGPSLTERLIVPRIAVFVLTCFREDTAYIERIGGVITCMLDDMNVEEFKDKEKRYDALVALRDWWYRNDQRPRAKEWVGAMWEELLKLYQTSPFVKQSLDFIIDWLIENKARWEPQERYNPNKWYPYGVGQVNFVIHGRGLN